MDLALFDLDHTLIPFDSGMAWTRFLAARGVLPAAAPDDYLAACQAYVDGRLDIVALHRATVAPLAVFAPAAIDEWATAFEAEMAPQLPPAMLALVSRHRNAGALCALVTATTRFIAEPFARLFDIPYVIATESARDARGRLTGEIFRDSGLFDPAAIDRLIGQHESGASDHAQPIWSLLMFDAWLKSVHTAPAYQSTRSDAAVRVAAGAT